jgi:8-oxo-dGTP pyrophosphatase MutT (NUDIX family)
MRKKLPWRQRSEVYIIKGKTLVVGKPKAWHGYIIPGGGIDKGETPIEAAQREALEEIGVNVKNLKFISTLKIEYTKPVKQIKGKMGRYIEQLYKNWQGAEFHTYIGKFDGYNTSKWGQEIDSYNTLEVPFEKVSNFFKKEANKMEKTTDIYNYEKMKYVYKILTKIRLGLI